MQVSRSFRSRCHRVRSALTRVLLAVVGILFVLFIGWIKFPHHLDNGGLVPNKGVAAPTLSQTAGALSFHWQPNVGTIVGGFITFLYLVRLLTPSHAPVFWGHPDLVAPSHFAKDSAGERTLL